MDRMTPRFRRRTQPADASTSPTPVVTGLPPKPAVPFRGGNPQASVRQPQSASPSVSSSLSSSSSGHIMSHPSTIPAPAGASLIPAPSLPKSLRTRRLYSAKRARSPQLSLAMPPPVAVVHREPSVALAEGGVALISPPPAAVLSGSRTGIDRNDEAVASKDGSGNSRQVSPVANTPPLSSGKSSVKQRCVPAFLSPSTKYLLEKFADLQFIEAYRSMAAELSGDPNHQWATFDLGRSRRRLFLDRYINIRPWNSNRVQLQVPPETVDYVNASYIHLASQCDPTLEPLRYIAMQGPTPGSVDHVWRMVAEQAQARHGAPVSPPALPPPPVQPASPSNTADLTSTSSPPPAPVSALEPGPIVIVQLTQMAEHGVVKCHPYFPSTAVYHDSAPMVINASDRWRDGWRATLTFDGAETLEAGAIEKTRLLLHIRDEEEPRVVWHLLFHRWPDSGVPGDSDIQSFFKLMRLSRELNSAGNRRIIHCSAGVGRTGTFMALEHLLRELDSGGFEKDPETSHSDANQNASRIISSTGGVSLLPPSPPSPPLPPSPSETDSDLDPVFATVDALRAQRKQMVQTGSQFMFIYSVLRTRWLEKYRGQCFSAAWDNDGGEPTRKRLGVESPTL